MLMLLIAAIVGLFVSFFVHIRVLSSDFLPPGILVTAINVGYLVIGFAHIFIGKNLRESIKLDQKDFRKACQAAWPDWMKVALGFIAIYGVVVFIFCLGGAVATASNGTGPVQIVSHKFFAGLSALVITFYAVEIGILYSYRNLNKTFVNYCADASETREVKIEQTNACHGCGKAGIPQEFLFKISSGQRVCAGCLKEMEQQHKI